MVDIRREVRLIKIITIICLFMTLICIVVCPEVIVWLAILIFAGYVSWLIDMKVWLEDKKIWLGYDEEAFPRPDETWGEGFSRPDDVWEAVLIDLSIFYSVYEKFLRHKKIQKL